MRGDRPSPAECAYGCARAANDLIGKEARVAAGKETYAEGEDRDALIDVAGQYIALAQVYAAIAALGPDRPASLPAPSRKEVGRG